jgi:tRNA-2-methylthio-N6-dimethylallyladenosine synthase
LEDDDFLHPPVRGHSVRAWVNVITGCNEHCTYCVVPATRGLEQSKPPEAILAEILHLANHQDYKEVTLLGQNIDAYGRDMIPKRTFADLLLYLVAHVPDNMRIRYVSALERLWYHRRIKIAQMDLISLFVSFSNFFR